MKRLRFYRDYFSSSLFGKVIDSALINYYPLS